MRRSAAETARRYGVFLAGLFCMALAVSLLAKAELGISPVQSAAYVVYQRLAGVITLGTAVLVWNCMQVAAQLPLLGRAFGLKELVQIPLSLLLGVMVDATGRLLAWLTPASLPAWFATACVGVAVLAFSVSLTVAAGVVMNAGEALVQAIARRGGWRFGSVKEVFDLTVVSVAVALSFLFFGRWRLDLIGPGTLLSAGCTGFLVRWFNRWIPPVVEKICVKTESQ